jgi:hypothetical protein
VFDYLLFYVKWLRYQRVISLEMQGGITSQRNKWANTDPLTYRRWDQESRRSKHPLTTGRTRRVPYEMAMIPMSNQSRNTSRGYKSDK